MIPEGSSVPLPPFALYRLCFVAEAAIRLPAFSGSLWRGLFGKRLREAHCVSGAERCRGCLHAPHCIYAGLFETPRPAESARMRRYPTVPRPIVIRLPTIGRGEKAQFLKAGSPAEVGFVLVGEANLELRHVVDAFRRIGAGGIGGGGYTVAALEQWAAHDGGWRTIAGPGGIDPLPLPPFSPVAPAVPERVALRFESPLRIEEGGRPVAPDQLEFHHLFRNLLRRLSSLAYFHTATELELDFSGLSEASRSVAPLGRRLHWYDAERFSGTQKKRVPIGGVVGQLEFSGEGLAPFWPFLWHGQWLHAGKGTVMGLGRYSLFDSTSL